MSFKIYAISGVKFFEAKLSDLKTLDDLEMKLLETIPNSVCLNVKIFENLQLIERLPEIPQGMEFVELQFYTEDLPSEDCVKNLIRKGRNDLLESFDFSKIIYHPETFWDVAIMEENLQALKILNVSNPFYNPFYNPFSGAVREGKFKVAKFFLSEMSEILPPSWFRVALVNTVEKDNVDFLQFVIQHPETLNAARVERFDFYEDFYAELRNAMFAAVDGNGVLCAQFLFSFDILGRNRDNLPVSYGQQAEKWWADFLQRCPLRAKTEEMVKLCLANGSVVDLEFQRAAVRQGNLEKVRFCLRDFPEVCSLESVSEEIEKVLIGAPDLYGNELLQQILERVLNMQRVLNS